MDKLNPKAYKGTSMCGGFLPCSVSETSKNSSHTVRLSEQYARIKRVVEVKFVHSKKKYNRIVKSQI